MWLMFYAQMSLRSAGVGSGAMAGSSTLPGSGKAIWSHEFMAVFVENYLWGMVLNIFIEVLY